MFGNDGRPYRCLRAIQRRLLWPLDELVGHMSNLHNTPNPRRLARGLCTRGLAEPDRQTFGEVAETRCANWRGGRRTREPGDARNTRRWGRSLAPRICSVLPGGRRSKLIWALCYLCHPHSRRPNQPSQRRCYGSRRGMSPRGRPTELQQRLYDLRPPNPRAAHSPRSAKISRGATPSAMRSMNSHGGSARSPRGLSGPGRRFRRGRAGRNRRRSSRHAG